MVKSKVAVFAVASAFALFAALPASALDREDKAPKEPRGFQTAQRSSGQPNISVAGHGDPDKLRFRRQQIPQRPGGLFEKDDCSFTCGGWTVTCSGETVVCGSSSCAASGGGILLLAECVN
jgi:hypothetical protein